MQPGRWTVLLICPDAAMLADLLLAQAKQTEEEGRLVWLPLNPLWKSSFLQVSADIIAVQICVFTPISLHLIFFAVQMNVIIRPACRTTWNNLLFSFLRLKTG